MKFTLRSLVATYLGKPDKVKVVHLGCNQSCNHVNLQLKAGKKVIANSSAYPKGNYTPDIYATISAFAKKQLPMHGKLKVNAHVCVHPPGPENFCKSATIMLRSK